ncbi:hypothetical protein KV557_40935, partial [Kitasatospora aureofaciens]|nr:hypothetical protein [Kitasatospora aureofaciens]
TGKIHPGEDAPKELPGDHPGSTPDHPVKPNGPDPLHTPAKAKVPEMAGVGGRDGVIKLGSDLSDPFKVPDHIPDHFPDRVPDHVPEHIPDHLPDHTPGGHAPEGPNASHEPPGHNDGPGHDGNGGHTGGGDHNTGGHDGGSGDHTGGSDHTGGHDGGSDHPTTGGHDGAPGSGEHPPAEEPLGNRPDGSWEGEKGLKLNPEANAAADKFIHEAATHEPRVTEAVQDVAGKVDNGKLIGLEYRLKGEDSLKRKLATDLGGNALLKPEDALAEIKDSVRYTIEVPANDYAHGVQQAVEDLQKRGFENITFKNTWGSAGYKGINSTWRDAVTGQKFELQFHTPDSFTAKMDGHVLYEKERLPGLTPDELTAIKAEQADLFGKVHVPEGAADIKLPTEPVHDIPTGTTHEPHGTGHNPGTEHPKPDGTHTPNGDHPSGSDHNGGGDHTPGDHNGGHDGPTGGDHTGGSDHPTTGGHDGTPGHGGGDHNGPGNGQGHEGGRPEKQPGVYLEGDHIGQQPSGPMAPEHAADVFQALRDAKLPPQDAERALVQLKKQGYGASVADYIRNKRFADCPGYKKLIEQVKDKGMMPAVNQALDHAAELESKGMTGIEFELKLPDDKLDLDVLTRGADGKVDYAAQLKDIQGVSGIKSAVKKIAEKQLGGSGVGFKIGILDIDDLRGAMGPDELQAVQRAADRSNATFELRFNDGSVTVFPTNSFKP